MQKRKKKSSKKNAPHVGTAKELHRRIIGRILKTSIFDVRLKFYFDRHVQIMAVVTIIDLCFKISLILIFQINLIQAKTASPVIYFISISGF